MEDRHFRFSVDENGKFTYVPKDDWVYAHDDRLFFNSPNGPFTISSRRTDHSPWPGVMSNPIENLHSRRDPAGGWVAEVNGINDGLTQAERDEARRQSGEDPGFIAKYKYIVAVMHDDVILIDETQTGTYQC